MNCDNCKTHSPSFMTEASIREDGSALYTQYPNNKICKSCLKPLCMWCIRKNSNEETCDACKSES